MLIEGAAPKVALALAETGDTNGRIDGEGDALGD
jgi:hypothetical protein